MEYFLLMPFLSAFIVSFLVMIRQAAISERVRAWNRWIIQGKEIWSAFNKQH
jgi:hypothetical protein